jgi:hypothetical protein
MTIKRSKSGLASNISLQNGFLNVSSLANTVFGQVLFLEQFEKRYVLSLKFQLSYHKNITELI